MGVSHPTFARQDPVLRFEEADLIGRWFAVTDPDWLDAPWAAAGLAAALHPHHHGRQRRIRSRACIWQAWQNLRVLSVQQILTSLERSDWRGTDVRWRQTPAMGWTLFNRGDVLRGRRLRSSRHERQRPFPFHAFRAVRGNASGGAPRGDRTGLAGRGQPHRDLATASMEDADPARWPILADALEEHGCQLPGLRAAFRPPLDRCGRW